MEFFETGNGLQGEAGLIQRSYDASDQSSTEGWQGKGLLMNLENLMRVELIHDLWEGVVVVMRKMMHCKVEGKLVMTAGSARNIDQTVSDFVVLEMI